MKCINCNCYYLALDGDAGTTREHFCSDECEKEYDKNLDILIDRDTRALSVKEVSKWIELPLSSSHRLRIKTKELY